MKKMGDDDEDRDDDDDRDDEKNRWKWGALMKYDVSPPRPPPDFRSYMMAGVVVWAVGGGVGM